MTEAAKVYLGEKGFDPVLGARPLRRLIQNEVEDSLSDEILSGRLTAGDVAIIDYEDEIIKIKTGYETEVREEELEQEPEPAPAD